MLAQAAYRPACVDVPIPKISPSKLFTFPPKNKKQMLISAANSGLFSQILLRIPDL